MVIRRPQGCQIGSWQYVLYLGKNQYMQSTLIMHQVVGCYLSKTQQAGTDLVLFGFALYVLICIYIPQHYTNGFHKNLRRDQTVRWTDQKENLNLYVKTNYQLVGLWCLSSTWDSSFSFFSDALGLLHNFLNEGMSLFRISIGQHWSLLWVISQMYFFKKHKGYCSVHSQITFEPNSLFLLKIWENTWPKEKTPPSGCFDC